MSATQEQKNHLTRAWAALGKAREEGRALWACRPGETSRQAAKRRAAMLINSGLSPIRCRWYEWDELPRQVRERVGA